MQQRKVWPSATKAKSIVQNYHRQMLEKDSQRDGGLG